jgi:glycolate oxidase subunit GlcD
MGGGVRGAASGVTAIERDLMQLLGREAIQASVEPYGRDSTEMQGFRGIPDAVVTPSNTEEIQRLVEWCKRNGVPIVPRGGGSGFAGGAVPVEGGIVCSMERFNRVVGFEPLLWRATVQAGVTTQHVHQLARENGLLYPPDPGASEQSHIGGNIACNAGGPHSFKYGVTGSWVTGIQFVTGNGDVIQSGGTLRKDVSGFDIKSLIVGSEGTLGIVTAASLRFIPAPEKTVQLVVAYDRVSAAQEGLLAIYGNGLVPSLIEFLDGSCLALAGPSLPLSLPRDTEFVLICEADGSASTADEMADDLKAVLQADAIALEVISDPQQAAALWRWRSGVSFAVISSHGGKMSEDVVVPVESLTEMIVELAEIGKRFDLPTCSWGHAGDGNLHATFLLDAKSTTDVERATIATRALFEAARRLGGSPSGEHGLGWLKREEFEHQFGEAERELHYRLKRTFDPYEIMNPGKKFRMPAPAEPEVVVA